MTKIKGIDVSRYQGKIDFKKVKADGVKFVIIREGYRKTMDSKFIDNVNGCKENNIPIMVYHFIYTDGATIADNAKCTAESLKVAKLDSDTWIAIDLEYDTWKKNGETCTKAVCTKYTKEYLNALKTLGYKNLFIYTNIDYYKRYYDWNQLQYPIWLADYSGEADYPCVIQQYSSTGKVDGIMGIVDMNWLYDETMITKNKEKVIATAEKVIQVAEGEVGYKEKKTNAQLDDKNANAGHNNFTKYARDFDEKYSNWYNGKKNGYAWCDMFVDWCFLTAFGSEKALELLCQPEHSGGAGCTYSYNYYKKKGQVGRKPKIGAQIFFGNESHFSHTGIVYNYDNTYVYTIEGNASDQVSKRKYRIGAENLYYGYPNYDTVPTETVTTPTTKPAETAKPNTTTTSSSILTKGAKGNSVKEMQQMLIKLGYSCGKSGADGIFGDDTLKALKKFQTNSKLKVNGIYDLNTKTKLTKLYQEIDTTISKSYNITLAGTYTTTANLNLRKDASMKAKIIKVIPKGSKVICKGYFTGEWYYVTTADGIKGFCNKQYLKANM